MKYKTFRNLIKNYKTIQDNLSQLYALGFDLMEGPFNMSDPSYNLLKLSLESHYSKEGIDWVEWFIFESDYGQKDFSKIPTFVRQEDGTTTKVIDIPDTCGAHDEEGNPICYNYKSLYKYLLKNHTL